MKQPDVNAEEPWWGRNEQQEDAEEVKLFGDEAASIRETRGRQRQQDLAVGLEGEEMQGSKVM